MKKIKQSGTLDAHTYHSVQDQLIFDFISDFLDTDLSDAAETVFPYEEHIVRGHEAFDDLHAKL